MSENTLLRVAHLFVLCAFAFAQPVFDLLSGGPEFFFTMDMRGRTRDSTWGCFNVRCVCLGVVS